MNKFTQKRNEQRPNKYSKKAQEKRDQQVESKKADKIKKEEDKKKMIEEKVNFSFDFFKRFFHVF